ncbi:hypothetical protein QFC21_006817 [Naganishia friedmannii]|uniref:Uncharacterized protein n=1 Tax=Naganishia friedmannii TaxID=89922 RepID=A0ACC2UZY3_9TREE|nr:hypothetical protein QFC21_006817 [Naganishia friedmannii]
MSAIAARRAALLLQKAASSVVSSAPVIQPTADDIPALDLPQPKASSSKTTYSKKNIKRERSSRTPQRPSSSKASPFSNGSPYQPIDRVVVEIDVMEDTQDDEDMDEVDAGEGVEQGDVEAEASAEEESDAVEDAGQAEVPCDSIKETPRSVSEPREPTSDESEFAFDFSEPGTNAMGGRPRKKRRVEAQSEEQLFVSSFKPSEDYNIYRLSADDVSRMSPRIPSKKAVAIILQPGEDHLPTSMVESCRPSSIVFLLQELDSGLENMPGPAVGLHKVWPEGKGAFGLYGVHPVLRQAQSPVYRHITPQSWTDALNAFGDLSISAEHVDGGEYDDDDEPAEDRTSPCIALVKGAKRSGKSTFTREIVNRLLRKYERVAYLDTDLGQSEFGTGGTVGLYILEQPLLGPAFSHPRQPLRSHFIGSLTPRLLPEYYMSCISQLLDQYRYEVQYPIDTTPSSTTKISEVVPLIINTQGWVKGLGADLLLQIEHLAEPTHTFTFVDQSDTAADNQTGRGMHDEPAQLFQGEDYGIEPDVQLHGGYGNVFHLQSIPVSPLLSRFTASDMRIITTISYLHARISDNNIYWDFSSPLACHTPWQVDLETVFQELYLTGEGADGIIQDDLPLVLNARLVALVERVEGTTEEAFYQPGRQLPDPSEVNCVGFGLIRSISPDGKTIHLLSPIEPAHLGRVNIMMAGELELPVCGMLDWRTSCSPASVVQSGLFGVPWADVPYLTVGADQGVGMGRRKWRRNIMRKGQGA